MYTNTDYFKEHRPKPKFLIGDRVFGRLGKIPFIGTVLNDNMVNEEIGPLVSVHLDLPFINDATAINIVRVKQTTIKKLVKY